MGRPIPKGPSGKLFFGNLPDMGKDALGFFRRAAGYGDVVGLQLGSWPACLINRPDLIEEVLVKQARNFIKHRFFWRHVTAIFGHGLVTNEGESWRRQRRLAQPAFHRNRVDAYGSVMVDYAERMLDEWKDGEVRDLHRDMMRLTMEIVTRTLFGVELDDATSDEIADRFDAAVEVIATRFRRPFRIPDAIPIPSNLRYRKSVERLDALVYRFIDECRNRKGERDDLLALLMDSRDEDGSSMSDEQLRDEAITIFLAGHETTAITLTWALILIAQHPDVERTLLEEIESVLGPNSPRVEDIQRLPFTTHVVNEAMRLFPPAYVIGREALADCEVGGFSIPAGTTVFMSQWTMHRDGRYFDSPEQFRPQRWEGDFAKKLPKFAFFPFGGGPRVCIGASFAMMEATMLLSAIVQRFHLELLEEQDLTPFPSITLRPRGAVRVRLTRRDQSRMARVAASG